MKKIFITNFILIAFFIYSNFSFSQAPLLVNQKKIGADKSDTPFCIKKALDDGYLIGGWSYSNNTGDKSGSNMGNSDFWLIKVNNNLEIVWEKSFGGNGIDALTEILIEPNGNIFVLGHSSSANGDKSYSMGRYDYWVIKLDSDGFIIWERSYGGSNDDILTSAVFTPSGDIILLGYTFSGISGHIGDASRGLYTDLWCLKIDPFLGNIFWSKRLGGNNFEESHRIISDGNYLYLTATTYSGLSGELHQSNRGVGFSSDFWLIKMNFDGQIIWENRYGGTNNDFWAISDIDNNGNIILAGTSDSNISFEKSQNSINESQDFWVLKIDPSGEILWDKTIGGQATDRLFWIKTNSNGEIFLGGNSNSDKGSFKSQNSRNSLSTLNLNYDYWLVKLNSSGNFLWDRTYGGDYNDEFRNMELDGNEFLTIIGFSNSNISGDKTSTTNLPDSEDGNDIWILRLELNNCNNIYNVISNDINISNNIFKTSLNLNSNAKINTTENVYFSSERSISLNPGFETKKDYFFEAKIEGCN
ncbi:MAG: hypothetical protein LCH67_18365 [Bacteroidetes bacterium]|nr:hypothetical protein [Bacteroidota bacterium]